MQCRECGTIRTMGPPEDGCRHGYRWSGPGSLIRVLDRETLGPLPAIPVSNEEERAELVARGQGELALGAPREQG